MLATKLHIPDLDGKTVLETVKWHLRASMKRLQTDYVGLYYWHRMNPAVPLEEVAEAMGILIKEGFIGGWGLSQITEEQLRTAHAVTTLTAVQSEYSMIERVFEKDVIPACEELGVGFVPFSPLGAGFLSGKYTAKDQYFDDDVRRVIMRFLSENMDANRPLLDIHINLQRRKKQRLRRLPSHGCCTRRNLLCRFRECAVSAFLSHE